MTELREIAGELFCGAASQVVVCDFCGVCRWSTDGDWDEGELESFEQDVAKSPDRHCGPYGDLVRWANLFGKTFVLDCRCKGSDELLADVWRHRPQYMQFFVTVHATQLKELNETKRLVDAVDAARKAETLNDTNET